MLVAGPNQGRFGQIEYTDAIGYGNYNGLQASLTHRFERGLSIRAAYTYSRALDNAPEELESNSGSPPDGRNFKVVWPGSIYAVDSWVVLKGAENKQAAMDFIAFASKPENQVKLPPFVAYGLPNKEAAKDVPPLK